jgi:hypothetical protein
MKEEPPLAHLIVIGAALCLGLTSTALLILGADVLLAIGLGFVAAILSALLGGLWVRRA